MTTAIAPISNQASGEEFLFALELDFADFRSRIALMNVEACGTLTDMSLPLGSADEEVIDLASIKTVERDVFDLTAAAAAEASAFELLEAFDLTIASVEEAGAIMFNLEPVAV